jgi:hypothetical protein
VGILHVHSNGVISARRGILRALPRVEDGAQVDLFLVANVAGGMMDLHVVLPPRQAAQLIEMLRDALALVGGADA